MNILTRIAFLSLFSSLCFSGEICFKHSFKNPVILPSDNGIAVSVEGCETLPDPGNPEMPVYVFEKEIPTEEKIEGIEYSISSKQEIRLNQKIRIAEIPFTFGYTGTVVNLEGYIDTDFPKQEVLDFQEKIQDGQKFCLFRFIPAIYSYRSDKYTHFQEVVFKIKTTSAAIPKAISLPQTSIPAGEHEYVILTTSSYVNIESPYNLEALLAYRHQKGFTTNLVTVDWIYQNYSGTTPQYKIREFCKDAYANWGTRFLLLAGSSTEVPTQMFYFSGGFATTDFPQDQCYYGNLDGTFDYNQNGLFGEDKDGEEGKACDYFSEINIGRFPAWTQQDLVNMVRKTILREEDMIYDKFLFCGEEIDPGISSSNNLVYLLTDRYEIFNSMGVITRFGDQRVYDQFYPRNGEFDSEISRDLISSGYSMISHLGHGSEATAFGISSFFFDFNSFTNSRYPLFYSIACFVGAFDRSHSKGRKSFVEGMMSSTNGVWAFCGNQREGWYTSSGPHYSVYFMRRFHDDMLRETSPYLGKVFNTSKEKIAGGFSSLYGYLHFVYFSQALFGDPAATLFPAVSTKGPYVTNLATTNGLQFSCNPKGIYRNPVVTRFGRNAAATETKGNLLTFRESGNSYYEISLQTAADIQTNFNCWVLNNLETNFYFYCETNFTHPPPYPVRLFTEPNRDVTNLYFFNQEGYTQLPVAFTNGVCNIEDFPFIDWEQDFSFGDGIRFSETNRITRRYAYSLFSGGNRLMMSNSPSFELDTVVITNAGNADMQASLRLDFEEDMIAPFAMQGLQETKVIGQECWISNIYVKSTSEIITDIEGLSEQQGFTLEAKSGTNVFSIHSVTNISLPVNSFVTTRMLRPFTFKIIPDVEGSLSLNHFVITDIRKPRGHVLTKTSLGLSGLQSENLNFAYFPTLSDSQNMKIRVKITGNDFKNSETNYYWKTNKGN